MYLETLIQEFLKIDTAVVGRGYLYPKNPELSIKGITEEFINKYSFIERDKGYVEFLRKYSGAYIGEPSPEEDPEWTVDIFGFYFDWMYYRFQDEYTIDDHIDSDGYLGFCSSLFENQDISGISYFFNKNKLGIFQIIGYKDKKYSELPMEWCSNDFMSWFNKLIKTRGFTF